MLTRLCWCTVCFNIRSLVSLHFSEEVSPEANFSWARVECMLLFLLSNCSLSVFLHLACSTLLDSFKKIQNTLSSASLSNLCDEFHHIEHNCQDVKLCFFLRRDELFGFLLEVDSVFWLGIWEMQKIICEIDWLLSLDIHVHWQLI